MWSTNLFSNTTLVTIGIYITNLSYLKDKLFCFIKLSNIGIEKSNRILIGVNIAIIISKTNNQDLLNLIDLEVKRANKKNEKAERCRQRKIDLA